MGTSNRGSRLWIGAAVAAALAVAGCASTDSASEGAATTKPASVTQLAGGQWDVKTLNGQDVIPNVPINITFEDGRVYGAGSCNRFMGSYTPGKEFAITMSQMASTMMACADAQMQQEQTFLNLLADVTGYSVDAAGTLTLSTADGRTITAQRAPA
ncbi:MAG: META domain-containing protein [Thermaurantiacus sp.]